MNLKNLYLSYQLIKDMAKKWTDFDAYDLGLIDDSGKRLRYAKTDEEKNAVSPYMRIVFNLKRILGKFLGAKNINIQRVVSLYLLKEGYSDDKVSVIVESMNLPKSKIESDDVELKRLIHESVEF